MLFEIQFRIVKFNKKLNLVNLITAIFGIWVSICGM
jgi:hypothetical protein